MLPSFASGSSLVIYINDIRFAYITNLSWSADVAHAAVGGVGSFNYDTIEPLSYLARGSFSIMHYDAQLFAAAGSGKTPARATETAKSSFLHPEYLSPAHMLTSASFDIKVYKRETAAVGDLPSSPAAKLAAIAAATKAVAAAGEDVANKAAAQAELDAAIAAAGAAQVKLQEATEKGLSFTVEKCRLTSYSLTFTPGQLLSENIGFIAMNVTDHKAATSPAATT